MIKKIIVFLVVFFLSTSTISAQNSFDIDALVTYEVKDNGITHVTNEITLTNLRSEVHAEEFVFNLQNLDSENVKAYENSKELDVVVSEKNDSYEVTLLFDTFIVGKDKTRSFSVEYDDSSLAKKSGGVWEIKVPQLENDTVFDEYLVELIVPEEFGGEAYMSPEPVQAVSFDGRRAYSFSKNNVKNSGISAGFGAFQVFSFSLTYHLEHTVGQSSLVEIALPPDTSTQRMFYTDISPKPLSIRLDQDGNWMAQYDLSKQKRVDVVARGSVQILSAPFPNITVEEGVLSNNLKSTTYWPVDNPQIQEIAKNLTTPREIYDYVVNNLSYNYGRVNSRVERLGAEAVLANPENAICTEYTDLFITLARAAGIPAREINGYAYSENPELEPLSLVSDVLHSWPEYWDKERKTWVPVDPTWGSTSSGVDFFDAFDLRHFAFVIHGESDIKPFPPGSYKLGDNPQKDVYVTLGQLPQVSPSELVIETEEIPLLSFTKRRVHVRIINPDTTARYNMQLKIRGDEKNIESKFIEVMLPYGIYEFDLDIPSGILGVNTPQTLAVEIADTTTPLRLDTFSYLAVRLLVILIIIGITLIALIIRLGKIPFRDK